MAVRRLGGDVGRGYDVACRRYTRLVLGRIVTNRVGRNRVERNVESLVVTQRGGIVIARFEDKVG